MPNLSAKRSADPWLRDPTATATPESASRRSVTNVLAIPPVPRIPHRTGLSATSSSLRRPVSVISLFKGHGGRPGSSLGRHLADAELLDEQQAVGVGPVFGELAVGDAQGVGAGEGDGPADRVGGRAGEAAGVGS